MVKGDDAEATAIAAIRRSATKGAALRLHSANRHCNRLI
jgi:hypothetical protein